MQVHLFGASTSGHALKLQINSIQPSFDLFPYSRSDSSSFLATSWTLILSVLEVI